MATLREISFELENMLSGSVNEETGELIFDDAALLELNMERSKKIDSICCYIKEDEAMASAIRDEEKALAERRKRHEKRAEHWTHYIQECIEEGETFESPRCAIKWSKSSQVETTDKFLSWAKRKAKTLLKIKEPEPDKVAIRAAIKAGTVPEKYAYISNKLNMKIK